MKLKHLEDGTCKTFAVDGDDDHWVMRQSMPGMLEEIGYDFIWYRFTYTGWDSVSRVGNGSGEQFKYEEAYQKGLA